MSGDRSARTSSAMVSALGQPQWRMEIDVIAVIPDDWPIDARKTGIVAVRRHRVQARRSGQPGVGRGSVMN